MKFCPLCKNDLIEKIVDNEKRVGCSNNSCNYVLWNNPIPVVAAIVEINNKIVLARNISWPEDMFGLITGFLEKGETPESAILREVKEELNLTGESHEFIGNYSFFEMNQLIIAFHVKAKGEIKLNEELIEYKLVSPEKLIPWKIGTGPAVSDWLKNRTVEDIYGI